MTSVGSVYPEISLQESTPPDALIIGHYGFGNLGDEAILAGMLRLLREMYPAGRWMVSSGDPADTRERHGVLAVDRTDVPAVLKAAYRSRMVIVGGGGLLSDQWGFRPQHVLSRDAGDIPGYLGPALAAATIGRPIVVWGVGVGPFGGWRSHRWVRALAEVASEFTVRTEEDQAELQSIGITGSLVAGDPAWLLEPVELSSEFNDTLSSLPRPIVAVAPRSWGSAQDRDNREQMLAQALNAFCEKTGGSVVFVPMQELEGDEFDDRECCQRVGEMLTVPNAHFTPSGLSPAQLITVFGRCELALNMRLHGTILAAMGGTPSVSISYDPKVARVAGELGLRNLCVADEEYALLRLVETLDGAWGDYADLSYAMHVNTEAMRVRARSVKAPMKRFLLEALGGELVTDSFGVHEEIMLALTRNLRVTQDDLGRSREDILELRNRNLQLGDLVVLREGELERSREDILELRNRNLQLGDLVVLREGELERSREEVLQLGDRLERSREEVLQLGDRLERSREEVLQLGDRLERSREEVLQLGDLVVLREGELERSREEVLQLGDLVVLREGELERSREEVLQLGDLVVLRELERSREEVLQLGDRLERSREEVLQLGDRLERSREEVLQLGDRLERSREDILELRNQILLGEGDLQQARDQHDYAQHRGDLLQLELDNLRQTRAIKLVTKYWRIRNKVRRKMSSAITEPEPVVTALGTLDPRSSDRPELPDRPESPIPRVIADRIAESRGVVVFLLNIEWYIHLFQRPQQLAQAFARLGYTVIYDNSNQGQPGWEEIEPRLFLYNGPPEVLHHLPDPLVWSLTYNWERAAAYPEGTRTVYDWIDELDVFDGYDLNKLRKLHTRALAEAVLTSASARSLLEKARSQRPDTLYLPNAVEFEHFSNWRVTPPAHPVLQRLLKEGRPIVGYYGAIARWLDYELLTEVAERRTDWSFLLIGPAYDKSTENRPLFSLPNVEWVTAQPYQDLPRWLQSFDIAMIPFVINEITESTSPLKLFEYFAGGKPVVCSEMPEVVAFPEVHAYRNADEMSEALDLALEGSRNVKTRKKLQWRGEENSWLARVRTVAERIEQGG